MPHPTLLNPTLLKSPYPNTFATGNSQEFINIYVEESRRTKVAGIVGPGCSETAAGIKDVTKQLDYILISYGSEGETLTLLDKKLDKKVRERGPKWQQQHSGYGKNNNS